MASITGSAGAFVSDPAAFAEVDDAEVDDAELVGTVLATGADDEAFGEEASAVLTCCEGESPVEGGGAQPASKLTTSAERARL